MTKCPLILILMESGIFFPFCISAERTTIIKFIMFICDYSTQIFSALILGNKPPPNLRGLQLQTLTFCSQVCGLAVD